MCTHTHMLTQVLKATQQVTRARKGGSRKLEDSSVSRTFTVANRQDPSQVGKCSYLVWCGSLVPKVKKRDWLPLLCPESLLSAEYP